MQSLRKATISFVMAGAVAMLAGCTISTPYQGPIAKGPVEDGDRPALVAITHARLGTDLGANIDFWSQIGRVVEAAQRQPGYLGHSLRRKVFGGEAWTITVWSDEASLKAFVRSEAHRRAIREGMAAIAEVRFARVTLDRAELPLPWDRAEELLAANSPALHQIAY